MRNNECVQCKRRYPPLSSSLARQALPSVSQGALNQTCSVGVLVALLLVPFVDLAQLLLAATLVLGLFVQSQPESSKVRSLRRFQHARHDARHGLLARAYFCLVFRRHGLESLLAQTCQYRLAPNVCGIDVVSRHVLLCWHKKNIATFAPVDGRGGFKCETNEEGRRANEMARVSRPLLGPLRFHRPLSRRERDAAECVVR